MVATCGGVFFGVAVWVALTAGLVWLAVFLLARYASLASIVAGHRAAGLRRRLRLPDVGRRLRRRRRRPRFSSCIAPTSDACARAPRAASTSGAPRMRKASRPCALRGRALARPGAPRRRVVRRPARAATDRPDVVTAQQVHAVVAIPSDAADHVRDGREPGSPTTSRRSPRGGRARIRRGSRASTRRPSAASTCLDITFVRLSETGAAYTAAGASGAFESDRRRAPAATGSPYKDYLVYYDGPAVETDVCGIGGTARVRHRAWRSRVVLAAGLPRACRSTRSRPTSCCTRSARSRPATPHACPGDAGHPCDSPTDVLYPFASGQPLSPLFLDFNHDDYYGHSGSVARHPGLALAAPAGRAGGSARTSRSRVGADHERPARRRLHRSLHDPVGSGRGRDAAPRPPAPVSASSAGAGRAPAGGRARSRSTPRRRRPRSSGLSASRCVSPRRARDRRVHPEVHEDVRAAASR